MSTARPPIAPSEITACTPPVTPETTDGAAAATVSSNELERLTGMSSERIRSWRRRHGFPEHVDDSSGVRRFFADDVPRIIAASHLISVGVRVADAIRTVQEQFGGSVDTARIGLAFRGIQAPAVAIGFEPLRVVWANRQASELSPSGLEGIADPGPQTMLARAVRAVILGKRSGAVLIRHDSLIRPGEAVSSIIWTAHGCGSLAPLALLIELPGEVPAPVAGAQVDRDTGGEEAWRCAVAGARRVLQRGSGLTALTESLGTLTATSGIEDAYLLHQSSSGLAGARSARGNLGPVLTKPDEYPEVWNAPPDRAGWLSEGAATHFTGRSDRRCLLLPLVAGGRRYGFVLLQLAPHSKLTEVAEQLVLGWATAAATVISRERARALRQRRTAQR